MIRTYIALGSNLAKPLQQVKNALAAINKLPQTEQVALSSFWRTPPYGPADQPDYLNAVIALNTTLSAENLLLHLQHIEQTQGRIRKAERWGPRTLDLDILLFGQQTFHTQQLTIPHYDLHNRAFMLVPLLEIAPDATLPDGRSLAAILSTLDTSQIQHW